MKYVKGYGFLSFARNISETYGKVLLDTATKTGLDATKSAFKKVAHKTAEGTAEVIGNKIVERIVKPKHLLYENPRNFGKIVILMMMMMMMMMMQNYFCGIVDRRKAFSLISSRDHCQRFSTSRISDTPQAGFELVQNLSSGLS